MNTAIFIRTHHKDAPWLAHCLDSLRKYASGHSEIVVATPDYSKIRGGVDLRKCRLVRCTRDHADDYIGQQITKVAADGYCRGDTTHVLYWDSDTLATRPFDVREFCTPGGNPIHTFRTWENAGTAICWRDITSKVLGFEPEFEFMAQMPIIHTVNTLELFRDHIGAKHRDNPEQWLEVLQGLSAFSEFNALGAFAYRCRKACYYWSEADPATDGYPRPAKQFWSHGGFTPAIHAEIHQILSA